MVHLDSESLAAYLECVRVLSVCLGVWYGSRRAGVVSARRQEAGEEKGGETEAGSARGCIFERGWN